MLTAKKKSKEKSKELNMEGSRDENMPLSRKKINWSSVESSKMKIQMRAVEDGENRTRLLV